LVFAVFRAIIIPFLYGYWKNDNNNQGEGIPMENPRNITRSPLSFAMIWKGLMYTLAIFTRHGIMKNIISSIFIFY